MGGIVSGIGKAVGGLFNDPLGSIGQISTWPFEAGGAAIKEAGNFTGINEIGKAGQWFQDFSRDSTVRDIAGLANLIAAGYFGAPADVGGLFGTEGMFSGEGGALASWDWVPPYDPESAYPLFSSPSSGFSNAAANIASESGVSPWLKYGLPSGLLLGSQYLGAKESKSAAEDTFNRNQTAMNQAQANALRTWQQTAFPNAATVGAAKKGEQANIAQRTQLARTNLANQMASRGMGAGSGLMGHEYAGIEKQKNLDMSSLAREMIKFQNTPQFAPPISTQAAQYPGYETFGQNISKLTSSAAGQLPLWYYLMSKV